MSLIRAHGRCRPPASRSLRGRRHPTRPDPPPGLRARPALL